MALLRREFPREDEEAGGSRTEGSGTSPKIWRQPTHTHTHTHAHTHTSVPAFLGTVCVCVSVLGCVHVYGCICVCVCFQNDNMDFTLVMGRSRTIRSERTNPEGER